MQLDALEAIRLGDTTQWIRVRGSDPSNPVLLLIQQGPGLPMINEVRRFEHLLALEQDFTVVYWDQRGCGRSLRSRTGQERITLDLMVDDTVSLLERLRDRFGKTAHVAGFSIGATIGARATACRPDLVATLVAVSLDVDGVAAAKILSIDRAPARTPNPASERMVAMRKMANFVLIFMIFSSFGFSFSLSCTSI